MNSTPNTTPNGARTEQHQPVREVFRTAAEPASASSTASATASTDQSGRTSNKPLRSGDVSPAIRSAPQTARSAEEDIRFYKALPYEQYLRTGHWRSRRNAALKLAGYKCNRCGVGRNLQVHHLSYERIGAELDTDLEVVCRGCHLGEHVLEIQNRMPLYLRIVSDALKSETFESLPDLLEEVKRRCARAGIPYGEGQIHAALDKLNQDKRLNFSVRVPRKVAELLDAGKDGQPYTHAEASGLIAKLGAQVALKSIPNVPRFTRRQADKLIVIRQLAALIRDQALRCAEVEAIADAAEAEAKR